MWTRSSSQLPPLGDYEIVDRIAEGSMAWVYRGRHRETGAVVAIKVPLPSVAGDPVLHERFRNEFRAGSSLRHPNIVQVLDFHEEGPTCYLVMEHVEGPDLWERIQQRGRLPEEEAVEIIVQVARGLHEAHKHGIIHRDTKPENILLAADGTAKLADLGLIKDLEAEFNLTRPGRGLGTPNFAAPEQFTEARHATIRCDIYSLGATLYMAVTGELPFQAGSLGATLRKKLNDELVPPRQLVRALSERVDRAIRRAMLIDPVRRYVSCPRFIQALTADEVPADAPPPDRARPPRPRPASERRRSVRYPCTLPTVCDLLISIHAEGEGAQESWPGTALDLSVSGVRLLLKRRFEPGTVVTVLLRGPDQALRRQLGMRVTWVERARDGQWLTGGTFVPPLERGDLRQLL
jgi:serine/threonine protein kinase